MPGLRGALGTLPLLKPREFRAQPGMFLRQAMGLRLELFEIGAGLLQHLLFHARAASRSSSSR